jgi:hypothetical protein
VTAYTVRVEYVSDDVPDDDFYGPFTSRKTADRFADRVRAAIASVEESDDMDRRVWVVVRAIQPPRVRPIRRAAAMFTGDGS